MPPSDLHTREAVSPPTSDLPTLTAYHIPGRAELEMVPAQRWRDWMEATDERWPNRCLPLLMANESAWWMLNPCGFTVEWDGGTTEASLRLALDEPDLRDPLVVNMFGYGIVTWTVPYLFRTDPGWNLLARGPANLPKDGICALEGLVETDWATATFTMNWKVTRPHRPVRFEKGEPFCAIVPQRRDELESFSPRKDSLANRRELEQGYRDWERSRDRQIALKFVSRYGTIDGFDPWGWEKDYFKGQTHNGEEAPGHQTKRRLRAFARSTTPSREPNGAAAPDPDLSPMQVSALEIPGCPHHPR